MSGAGDDKSKTANELAMASVGEQELVPVAQSFPFLWVSNLEGLVVCGAAVTTSVIGERQLGVVHLEVHLQSSGTQCTVLCSPRGDVLLKPAQPCVQHV